MTAAREFYVLIGLMLAAFYVIPAIMGFDPAVLPEWAKAKGP